MAACSSAETAQSDISAEPTVAPVATRATGAASDSQANNRRPGTGVTVRMGRGDWQGSHFQAAIYRRVLLELGFTVIEPEEPNMSADVAFQALATGEIDIWPNGLFPVHEHLLTLSVPGAGMIGDLVTPVGIQAPAGAMEGVLVNRPWATDNNIAYLDDIAADTALAQQFDVDGDGEADIFGCRRGTTCQALLDRLIKNANWPFNQITDSGTPLLDDAADRVESGAPTLLYGWAPGPAIARLVPGEDVVWLSVRAPVEGWATEAALGESTCPARPCNTGFVASDVRAVANREFLDDQPAAASLLESVEISSVDVARENELIDAGENTPADIDRHASEWISAHRPQVEEWLASAIAAQ